MLRVIARHADEWNMPSHGSPEQWGEASTRLDEACAEVGRDPAEIRRSVQIFLYPLQPEQVATQLNLLPRFAELGCEHAVLSFYQPPSDELLERCAALRES
jgi:alkanesulfonate monooxygenase SsuD/methylene tetrahydromethanopterin reductase-like flavin-dependent oxidoreductase (luciferase family)